MEYWEALYQRIQQYLLEEPVHPKDSKQSFALEIAARFAGKENAVKAYYNWNLLHPGKSRKEYEKSKTED